MAAAFWLVLNSLREVVKLSGVTVIFKESKNKTKNS